MKKSNETTAKNLEKLEQLEHRRQLAQHAEQKRETRRQNAQIFKIGEIVMACWPWTAQLKVHPTKEENEAEFAQLRELLMEIAVNLDFITNVVPFQHHQHEKED